MDTITMPQELQRTSARFAVLAYLLREEHAADHWKEVHDTCAAAEEAFPADDATALCRELLEATNASMESGDLETVYRHTFGHIPAGQFSPYETSYGNANAFSQSQALADLNGFYKVFGVEPAGEYRERHDHLSIQCEFLALLLYKEALAQHEDNAEGAEVCRSARRRFFEEHIGLWGGVLFDRLKEGAPVELYRLCGQFGAQVLAAEGVALEARCAAVECGAPPPVGIAEDYCPELFACPGTSDGPELDF